MSRREAVLKATAGALNPKGLDLTKYRQRGARERAISVRADEAAGALAFAQLDRYEDAAGRAVAWDDPSGVRMPGDSFPALLLRLKYADQLSRGLLRSAHVALVHHYGGLSVARSETLAAVGLVALSEWLFDRCPKCRPSTGGVKQPRPCLACGQRREGSVIVGQPTPGCRECRGLGRIFEAPQRPRGMLCVSCRNSGRVTFKPKRRWRMVSEYLVEQRRARNERPEGLAYDSFLSNWQERYWRFLDVLRATDQRIVAGLDFGFGHSHNRSIDSGREEKQQADSLDERAEGDCPTAHEPEHVAGELPSKES